MQECRRKQNKSQGFDLQCDQKRFGINYQNVPKNQLKVEPYLGKFLPRIICLQNANILLLRIQRPLHLQGDDSHPDYQGGGQG
jgi:hypothetical protein